MKIAILIQCHCNPEQINLMIDVLGEERFDFYVHVDKKSNITAQIVKKENVYFVDEEKRIDVRWGTISQVDATLALLKLATGNGKNYGYYALVSGQDFPIKTGSQIEKFFNENNGKNFVGLETTKSINGKYTNLDKRNDLIFPAWLMKRDFFTRLLRRLYVAVTGGYGRTFGIFKRKNILNTQFYFGSQWWCISEDFANYIINYLSNNPQYREFYATCSCPDESFFQTLLMNSEYANTQTNYLHYIVWEQGKSSPKNLTLDDYDRIRKSEYLFMRKVDKNNDGGLVEKIVQDLKE